MSEQVGPWRLSGLPQLGTVTADYPLSTALLAGQRAASACGLFHKKKEKENLVIKILIFFSFIISYSRK
jgi:hypothetical protein